MKDLKSKISVAITIASALIDETVEGETVDLQGFKSAAITFAAGTVTNGTHTPTIQESDNGSDWDDVAANDRVGALAAITTDSVQTVGYKGVKRYIRAVSTVTGSPATGGQYSALVIRGNPDLAPTA